MEDTKKIWKEFRKVSAHYLGVNPNRLKDGVSQVRQEHQTSKGWLYPYFDANGRIEVSLSDYASPISWEDCVSAIMSTRNSVRRTIFTKHPYDEYVHLYDMDRVFAFIENAAALFSVRELVNNVISSPVCNPSNIFQQLSAGTKFSTFLSLYAGCYHQWEGRAGYFRTFGNDPVVKADIIELVNVCWSIVLSSLKKRGPVKLVFSINPVDILMMSMSTANWDSCSALPTRAYSSAPISLNTDGVTAIAYAYRRKDSIYEGSEEYPVKLWRALVFLDKVNYSYFVGRHYPNVNTVYADNLRDIVGKILSEHAGKPNSWIVNKGSYCHTSSYEGNTPSFIFAKWVYADPPTSRSILKDYGSVPKLDVGGDMICLVCGRILSNGDNTEAIVCIRGCNVEVCERCENEFDTDELREGTIGDILCSECWHETYTECYDCGSIVEHSEAFTVSPAKLNQGEWIVCSGCLQTDRFEVCADCGDYTHTSERYSDDDEVYCRYCSR